MKAQRSNNITIRSLTDEYGRLVKGQDKICVALHKHITCLGKGRALDHCRWSLKDFLAGDPRRSAREAEYSEGPITSECSMERSPGLNGLPCEFYICMPDLFGNLLTSFYTNWQQNVRIPKSTSWEVDNVDWKELEQP